jgi:photosystem II stability/assembly factor-like uncharacterized protein
MKRISLLILSLLFFATAFQSDKLTSGWYQQYFPNLNGSTIKDMTFLDSLTGFAITSTNSSVQAYILKTTNGGDNWNIVHTYFPPGIGTILSRIMFANNIIGYVSTSYHEFFKTTNAGENWTNISEPPWSIEDLSVLNKDTLLAASSSGFGGGVFRSTNGGFNWQTIWTMGGDGNPQKIYMVNKDFGFALDLSYVMKRTTDGGFSWNTIYGEGFKGIKFIDSNTGWKIYSNIMKTTNGGINWFVQQAPNYPNSFTSRADISIINKDTVWVVGAYSNGGVVYKTTNGGLNWGYQYPNPALPISSFYNIQFKDSKHGWINSTNFLLHTKVGGNDTTIFTGINYNSGVVSSDYQLNQNYPNPFNPITKINFSIVSSPHVLGGDLVQLIVYDVMGREVQTLVNESLKPGTYEVSFDGSSLTSGVYFYRLIIRHGGSSTGNFTETKKMLLIK